MHDLIVKGELLAELVAIDVWDDIFEDSTFPGEIERIAYMTRQIRRQEIRRQILSGSNADALFISHSESTHRCSRFSWSLACHQRRFSE